MSNPDSSATSTIGSLAHRAKDAAAEMAHHARERIDAARDGIDERVDRAADRVGDAAEHAAKGGGKRIRRLGDGLASMVRKHPYAAIGIAASIAAGIAYTATRRLRS